MESEKESLFELSENRGKEEEIELEGRLHDSSGFRIEQDTKPSPELSANIFSRLVYEWLNQLMKVGYKRPIEYSDLYELTPQNNVHMLAKEASKSWEEEKEKGRELRHFLMAIIKPVWKQYVVAGVPLLIAIILQLVSPVVTSFMIAFAKGNDEPLSKGLLYALIVLVAGISSGVLTQLHYFLVQKVLMKVFFSTFFFSHFFHLQIKVNTIVTTLVYRKTLKVSGVDQGSANTLLSKLIQKKKIKIFH